MERAAQTTATGTEPDRDSPARIGAGPLDELEFHWGSAYHIAMADGMCTARRRDGKGSTLADPLPEGLRLRILADYDADPVPRDPARTASTDAPGCPAPDTGPSQNRTTMPAAAPRPAPQVNPPRHPLHALTTFELRAYRRQLENAIAFFEARHPVPPARDDLHAKLGDVLAEQDDRARLARA
jgi:hypothetical protein